jgi:hypothetical protein
VGVSRIHPEGAPLMPEGASGIVWASKHWAKVEREIHTRGRSLLGPNPTTNDSGEQEVQTYHVGGEALLPGCFEHDLVDDHRPELLHQVQSQTRTTLVVAVLAPDSTAVTVCNAGHLPVFLREPDGTVRQAATDLGGLPLGMATGHEFRSCTIELVPGAAFVLCTDGVTDALYNDQLPEVLAECPKGTPPALHLVGEAIERSGRDNTTAVIVTVG